MFSFGYKSSFSSLVRAAAAIGIGLVMVFGADRNAPILIVKLIAALIIIAGLALLFHALTKYRRHGNQDIRSAEELSRGESPQAVSRMRTLMVCNAAIVLVVGVLLLLYPKVLAGFVVTLIAIGLIALGAVQLFMMTSIMSLLGAGFSSLTGASHFFFPTTGSVFSTDLRFGAAVCFFLGWSRLNNLLWLGSAIFVPFLAAFLDGCSEVGLA